MYLVSPATKFGLMEAAIEAALAAFPGGGDDASKGPPYLVDLWPHSASVGTYKALLRIMDQPPPNQHVNATLPHQTMI